MYQPRRPVADRLYESSMPVTESGCWIWLLSLSEFGYGDVSFRGRRHRAHRVSWTVHNGEIPHGLHVLHRCDVPSCINPDHLFLGTPVTNAQDRQAKGRSARGQKSGSAKLTPEQVAVIRASKESSRTMARVYGVSHVTINKLRRGKTWAH